MKYIISVPQQAEEIHIGNCRYLRKHFVIIVFFSFAQSCDKSEALTTRYSHVVNTLSQ